MSSKTARIFTPVSTLEKAPATNYEGAPAFLRSEEEALVRVLMTGLLEPTFYVGERELAAEAEGIFARWATKDARFLAQAVVYAREHGFLRLAPITALVYLSTATEKRYFYAAFDRVIRTPGDLADFLTIIRKGQRRGMGRAIKIAVGRYLSNVSEYHAIKYGSDAQEMSLRDMFRLVRPKLTGRAQDIAAYLVKGEVAPNLEQIALYERFKQESDPEELLWLISEGKLPLEVMTNKLPNTPQAWATAMRQMPTQALLRHLVALHEHGVFASAENVQYAASVLTDARRIEKSGLFPFTFVEAAKMATEHHLPYAVTAAVLAAAELSLVNCPSLPGRTLIANDVSGSMGAKISQRSVLDCADVAAIMAAALFRRAECADVVSFDTQAYHRAVRPDMSLDVLTERIRGDEGGGTDMGIPLRWAQNYRYDNFVWITDSQDWAGWLRDRRGALDALRQYRQRVPNLHAYLVQLLPYQHAVAPMEADYVTYCYGFTGSTLAFIGQESQDQVAAVRRTPLGEVT